MNNRLLILLFWLGLIQSALSQTLPKGSSLNLPNLPVSGAAATMPATPEIPYLEELKQIQSLKKSYDSLKQEIRKLQEISKDSSGQDSTLVSAKERSKQVLDQETQTLESLIDNQDMPGEELRNAANHTLDQLSLSKETLKQAKDLSSVEAVVSQNEENLKALTNEWLMPKIEQQLTGTLTEGFDPRNPGLPDFYGKDALEQFYQKGVPAGESLEQAKTLARGKVRHISDEYLQQVKGDFSKLQLDSSGNVEVIKPEALKRKFSLLEPNELKQSGILERSGIFLWYDPLTSFGEGVYGDVGLSYRLTQQAMVYSGLVIKRQFESKIGVKREGTGFKVGLRFSKGHWLAQGEVSRSRVDLRFPTGYESRDFEGNSWATGLGLGRTIPIKSFRSVLLATWDPVYNEDKSLSVSRFQLKIGFELFRLRKPLENVEKRTAPKRLEDIKMPQKEFPVYFER